MESTEITQGAQPKENQTTNQTKYTEEEKTLAEQFNVEPKTIRVLNEYMKEQQRSDKSPQQPTEQPERTSTGILHLDWLLSQHSTLETKAAIHACLHICRQNHKLANDIEAVIRPDLQPFIEGKRSDPELDTDCDILPMIEWLSLLCGFEAVSRQANMDSKVRPSTETTEKSQSERYCKLSNASPALRGLVQWLLERTHTEKLAAVLLWELITKESEYKKEEMYVSKFGIGNDISKDWQEDILLASQNSELLKQLSPEDIAITAFTAALIPMSV